MPKGMMQGEEPTSEEDSHETHSHTEEEEGGSESKRERQRRREWEREREGEGETLFYNHKNIHCRDLMTVHLAVIYKLDHTEVHLPTSVNKTNKSIYAS